MAALRPEFENLLDNQVRNNDFPGLKHKERELKLSVNEVAYSDLCRKSGEFKGTKQSCVAYPQALGNSSLNASYVQSAFNSDLKHSSGDGSVLHKHQKLSGVSKENKCELIWSEKEEDLDLTRSKLYKGNSGHGYHMQTMDQTTEALRLAGNTKQQKYPPTQDEEEFTDISVEIECDGESEEDEDGKGEDVSREDKGHAVQPKLKEMDEEGKKSSETDAALKRRKRQIECRDCGKTFTGRETYNLHYITCSGLNKHRREHKVNGAPVPLPAPQRRSKQREIKEERGIVCDHCGERFASVVRFRLHGCQQNLEKPYRCPLCRREFQYRVSINAHMQCHSLESPYRCLECNKGFQCAVTLHIHQRSHATLKPYECPDCGMVFRHRSFMEDHRRRHTEERPHQCNICGKSFKHSSLLQQHQYLHTGQKPYRCAECGKRFAFAQNMRAHCRQHKKNAESTSPEANIPNYDVANGTSLETVGKENTNHDIKQQRNCPLCPQLFYKAADLRVHMLIHEAEYEKLSNGKKHDQVYPCSYCPLKFLDESSLQSHTFTHEVKSAPLKREVLSVARASSIDNMSGGGEWGDHREKKPLKCRECGKSFHYRSVLELHMRIHNKGYQCHVCKKSFRFSSYLQQHLIIHSGKKPYKCPDCGKDFAFLQNMKTHQRLHQQKPFRCTQCRKGYSDESQLQRHVLSHSGDKPHKCHLCDKSFGLAYLLRDHLNTHTGERPHRCQECHKSFPWLSSLLVHQKIHMRKRQGLSQACSPFVACQRGKARGGGTRTRKSSKWISNWSKMGEDMELLLQQAPFPGQILQGLQLPNLMEQQSSAHDLDVHEQTQLSTQQSIQSWQMDNPSRPIQLPQHRQVQMKPQQQQKQQLRWLSEGQQSHDMQPWNAEAHLEPVLPKLEGMPNVPQPSLGWAEELLSAQVGPATKQLPESCTAQDKGVIALARKNPSGVALTSNPSKVRNKQKQKTQKQPHFSASLPTSKSPGDAVGMLSSNVKIHSPVELKLQKSPNQLLNIQGQLSHWPVFSDIPQNTKIDLLSPTEKDNTIAFGLKTLVGTLQAKKESDKNINKKDEPLQGQQSTVLANQISMSTQTRKVNDTKELNSKPWSFRAPLEISKTLNLQENPVNEVGTFQPQLQIMQNLSQQQHQMQLVLQPQQQMHLLQQPLKEEQLQQQLKSLQQQPFRTSQLPQQQPNQLSPAWVSAPQANQIGPVSVQFGAARFIHGNRSTVWGFQSTPVVTQTLLNGPIHQGPGIAQQQVPVVSGPRILLNQTSPFITTPLPLPPSLALPGPHPIHSVSGQLSGSASQSVFFTPQGIVSERSVLPQALPSSHLAQQTEPHKMSSQMPFAPDHRFHCMVCGCTLPGELELQMHYMQHAQGKI